MGWRKVGSVDDVWSGEMRRVMVGGTPVLLVGIGGATLAYEDRCAHKGAPLSEGCLLGRQLTCSVHEWQYDAATGQGINPRSARLRRFPVKIEDGAVWVDVDRAPEEKEHD